MDFTKTDIHYYMKYRLFYITFLSPLSLWRKNSSYPGSLSRWIGIDRGCLSDEMGVFSDSTTPILH